MKMAEERIIVFILLHSLRCLDVIRIGI